MHKHLGIHRWKVPHAVFEISTGFKRRLCASAWTFLSLLQMVPVAEKRHDL